MNQTPTAIVLTNLGSPAAPTRSALRRYLAEFLTDPYVITTSKWIWWPILYGLILPFRCAKSAAQYQQVWTEAGSPLLVNSEAQRQALQHKIALQQQDVTVHLAMRYGMPSIQQCLQGLQAAQIEHLIVLPLYPQFSYTTFSTTKQAILDQCQQLRYQPHIDWISDYHQTPRYIAAVVSSIQSHFNPEATLPKLLFSFHGLPQDYVDKGDPYADQCHHTAMAIAAELGLKKDQWTLAYQSRFGPKQWLQPYADEVLRTWAQQGIEEVAVVCPGFSSDCLETLEEINQTYRQVYLLAGGKKYHYIPALNAQPAHIDMMWELVAPFL